MSSCCTQPIQSSGSSSGARLPRTDHVSRKQQRRREADRRHYLKHSDTIRRKAKERFERYVQYPSTEVFYVYIVSLKEGVLEGSMEALQRLEGRTATHRKAASKYRSAHRAELAEKEGIRRNKKVRIL
jgi:hypothetical protein